MFTFKFLRRVGFIVFLAFSVISKTSLAAQTYRCQMIFGAQSSRGPWSANLEDHYIRTSAGETFLPISTSESLVHYVENGGKPREGIPSLWSSAATLREVMSVRGPLGPKGPLGLKSGIIWKRGWSMANMLDLYFQMMKAHPLTNAWLNYWSQFGPLFSAFSPMGKAGPLYGNFREGVYNVLGTTGLLGALTLGPIGPIGALHGIVGSDKNGNYIDRNGQLITELPRHFSSGITRRYRPWRQLNAEFAPEQSKSWALDTSFFVNDFVKAGETTAQYMLTSPKTQLIEFEVIGADENQNLGLTVRDQFGNVILESGQDSSLVHRLQIQASEGARMIVEITRQDGKIAAPQEFGFMVVGNPYFDLEKEGVLEKPEALPLTAR